MSRHSSTLHIRLIFGRNGVARHLLSRSRMSFARTGVSARVALGALLALTFAACGSGVGGSGYEGTDFESAGWAGSSPPGAGADAGAAAPGEDSDRGADERTVEEADLYRVVGDRLYVLNSYRGLYVFDVSDPDHPRELGRMPLVGHPVEMYVRGDRAYAILSEYFTYWYDEAAFEDSGLEPYFGSRIVAIDLSDPTKPEELGDVLLDGYVADTRLVGDVIYAVANRYAWWGSWGVRESETRDLTVLTSIDLADPASIREVQQLTLDGNGWFVHATSDAFVVAGTIYSETDWVAQTEVRYVDISDPGGALAARGQVRLSGALRDDTAIDVHEDQLRVLTRESDGLTTRLRILDTSQPDVLPVMGELTYEYPGSVFGTTFTDDRLYMIHYMTIDPLEVVDLSDPTNPHITGILEMPGWVERIAVDGDRLIGLGVDDSDGSRRTSLTMFDVSDPAAPRLVARENVDAGWSWSSASWERKAWTVAWDEGLVLFPWSGYESTADWRGYRNALSIVEIGEGTLTTRGTVEAPAPVERGFLHEGRVYALSQAALQVVDVRDRTRPIAGETVELVRSVTDYVRTDRAGLELIAPGISWGWYGGDQRASLRVSPLGAPDGSQELARVALPRAADRLQVHGDLAIAVGTQTYWYGWYEGDAASDADARGPGLTFVDVSDPAAPEVVADLALPMGEQTSGSTSDGYVSTYTQFASDYGAPWGSYGGGAPLLDLGGGRFALVRTTTTSCSGLEACRAAGIEPQESSSTWDSRRWYYGTRLENDLVVIDVSDAARPAILGPFSLGEGRIERPMVVGGALVLSHALPSRVDAEGRSWVRWFYERWSIEGDGAPVLASVVNVPGVVLEVRGAELVTVDQTWGDDGEMRTALNGLVVEGSRARRLSELTLGSGWIPGLVIRGDEGFAIRSRSWERADHTWVSLSTLDTIDLSDLAALRVARRQTLDQNGWYLAALTDHTLALTGGWGGGLVLFDRGEDGRVTYRRHVRTNGWGARMREDGGALWIASGPYGLEQVALDD
jgi:hypothetical protein